jgi:hypothetical protein
MFFRGFVCRFSVELRQACSGWSWFPCPRIWVSLSLLPGARFMSRNEKLFWYWVFPPSTSKFRQF